MASNSEANSSTKHLTDDDVSRTDSVYFSVAMREAITVQPLEKVHFSKTTNKFENALNVRAIAGKEEDATYYDVAKMNMARKCDEDAGNVFAPLTQLYVRRNIEVFNSFCGWETKNRYVVQNAEGKLLYHVFETSNDFCRCCCGSTRCLQLHFANSSGKEIIRMRRPFKCSGFFAGRCSTYPICCLCDKCAQQISIESPPGHKIGSINQLISLIRPNYQVRGVNGTPKYNIRGSFCNFSCFARCCCSLQYIVTDVSKNVAVGVIKKERESKDKNAICIENINVKFPMDATSMDKILLLGALFFVNLLHFEETKC